MSGCEVLVVDTETNGLEPSEIFVVGVLDYLSGDFCAYVGDDIPGGLIRVSEAEAVIGHNLIGYDLPVIERLTRGLIKIDPARVVDTLTLARRLYPELPDHKLRSWGELLGGEGKGDWRKFDRFYPQMVPYCERDCRLTARLFEFLSGCVSGATSRHQS